MRNTLQKGLMVLALPALALAANAHAQERIVYVNDDWDGLTAGTVITDSEQDYGREITIGTNGFATINDGLSAVAEGTVDTSGTPFITESGGAVVVLPGLYEESITINKPGVKLFGARAVEPAERVLDPTWSIDDESVITNTDNNTVNVTAFGVQVDGFYIQNQSAASTRVGVRITQTNCYIANNVITRFTEPASETESIDPMGPDSRGIVYNTGLRRTTAHNNFISGFVTGFFNNDVPSGAVGNRVVGNTFFRNQVGAANDNVSRILYVGNTFIDNTLEAIGVGDGGDGFTVSHNNFYLSDAATPGINQYDIAGGIGVSLLVANDNYFEDHEGNPLPSTSSLISNALTDDDTDSDGVLVTSVLSEAFDYRNAPDSDYDGLPDVLEDALGSSSDTTLVDGRPAGQDTSGNGIEDGILFAFGYDPTDPNDPPGGPFVDNDGDGLPSILDPDDNDNSFDGTGIKNGFQFATGSNPFNPDSRPPVGDVSETGEVTLTDALDIFRFFLGLPTDADPFNERNADVNRDLLVDNVDGVILINYLLENTTIPFP